MGVIRMSYEREVIDVRVSRRILWVGARLIHCSGGAVDWVRWQRPIRRVSTMRWRQGGSLHLQACFDAAESGRG